MGGVSRVPANAGACSRGRTPFSAARLCPKWGLEPQSHRTAVPGMAGVAQHLCFRDSARRPPGSPALQPEPECGGPFPLRAEGKTIHHLPTGV